MNKYRLAILALIGAAFLNALMGVWSRLLTPDYELFQQVGLRALAGGCFGYLIYYSRKGIKPVFRINKRDFLLVLIRSIVMLIGILLFTYSINNGNFANVNMIYALPTTALLGFILLHEKITIAKIILIIVSFIGALMVSVDINDIGTFSMAEIAAIISTFFYSFGYITRKWISSNVKSEQIATLGSLLTGIIALISSFIIGNDIDNYAALLSSSMLIVIFAGLTYVFINYFLNYGFERVDAVVGNNILALSFIFGILIGIVIYQESPTPMSLFGGSLILISAILIDRMKK